MQKFLPLVLFILVFTAVLAGQATWKAIKGKSPSTVEHNAEYKRYEDLFLAGNYTTLDGKKLQISSLTAPVVIYNFWASWCNPCLEEMPSLKALKKRFSDQELLVVTVNTDADDQIKNINKTLQKIQIKNEFITIPDKDMSIAESFKFHAIPVTIIFNRGKVVHFSNGPMDFNSEEIVEKIKSWIKG